MLRWLDDDSEPECRGKELYSRISGAADDETLVNEINYFSSRYGVFLNGSCNWLSPILHEEPADQASGELSEDDTVRALLEPTVDSFLRDTTQKYLESPIKIGDRIKHHTLLRTEIVSLDPRVLRLDAQAIADRLVQRMTASDCCEHIIDVAKHVQTEFSLMTYERFAALKLAAYSAKDGN
jgi:hypothetical protein